MKIYSHSPTNHLAQFIKSYWMIERMSSITYLHTQRIVPTGLFELSFHLADKPVAQDQKNTISEPAVLTGQLNAYYDLNIQGNLSLFSIYFYPHTLALFVDMPMQELKNYTVPLKELFGAGVNELEDKLALNKRFEDRVHIAETFLLDQLHRKEANYQWNRIKYAIDLINHSRGQVDINFLASELCLSRKQFERIFGHFIGLSPKQFLRIVRFQNAIHLKSSDPILSLTSVAYRAGYFDQSHMINDFVAISGKTPKDYFKVGKPYSDYFE